MVTRCGRNLTAAIAAGGDIPALVQALQARERKLKALEYEELRSGGRKVLTYASFDALPKALVQARIARGWTQEGSHRILKYATKPGIVVVAGHLS